MATDRDVVRGYLVFLILSAAVLTCVGVISWRDPSLFGPYFGAIPPMLAAAVACSAGFGACWTLGRYYGFEIVRTATFKRGVAVAAGAAVPFMVAVTLADVWLRFPADVNVPLPDGLLFYPAMGFVAQVLLHVVPLAILVPLTGVVAPSWSIGRRFWVCIVLVATLEAAFQVRSAWAHDTLTALPLFVGVHLFLFGIVELTLFRRYDLVSMVAFRIIYYGYWHLLWGVLRLQWLFHSG